MVRFTHSTLGKVARKSAGRMVRLSGEGAARAAYRLLLVKLVRVSRLAW